jgi:fused signal recognition particle receptor
MGGMDVALSLTDPGDLQAVLALSGLAPDETTAIVVGAALGVPIVIGLVVGLLRRGRSRQAPPQQRPRPGVDYTPGVGDDAGEPRDTPVRGVETIPLPDGPGGAATDVLEVPTAPTVETPDPAAGRLGRLRARLARSNSALGKGLLALLSKDTVDEATWEEIEETLIAADLGTGPSLELVERLRERIAAAGGAADVRTVLREELVRAVDPTLDRSLAVTPSTGDDGAHRPAVVLVVGVNGVGKTTTVGKLARVLVSQDKDVVLGAADTFRAAAAEQLTTWGERVGVPTVRSQVEGADPAAVAYDAVKAGVDLEADVVLVDTAGRLQNKRDLMDELGKVKRVVERHGPVDEVLLVLDATTGQNGLTQARVFAEAVAITGIVLTKLDGTAKGGIVVAVQRELGVPVKLVGLGEGADDLAPFEADTFVDALLD